ncbi:LSU ribosomal protein L24P [Thermomonospora echinospora]|uniref:Large ribosomal subunit protein uL24 n=1 Tax=Thermomonospora echinospora TaxID=1992 RepID=A0A1H5Z943_9ACTN|nr:50S ribosomal protein L24 [Thermomonospora echinospora]SEG32594.1 LSU ribosomal protein L24P [Thermomonospora echinospora]
MKIRKGDEVVVIAGKDKGATGKVIHADPRRERVTVEGVNLIKKNTKADPQGKGGGVITREASLHISNVALVEDGKPVRVGYKINEDGTKVRISRRTGKEI